MGCSSIRRGLLCIAFVIGLTTLAPIEAFAQTRTGVQGGGSFDDGFNQIFFGGHVETAPLVNRLRFRPGLDVGLGDDATLLAFNFDFTYTFPSRSPWNLYAGGGPAINWINTDRSDDTEGGFNLLVGAKNRDGLFFELRLGLVDSPDVKFGVGYTFK